MAENSNNKIIELIFNLSRLVRSGMSFDSGSRHLTLHQLQTLLLISREKNITMADIARNFHITKPSATVLINSLVNKGYLKRTTGKVDRREIKISLAKKGQNLLNKAAKERSLKINKILSYISEKEKKRLGEILQKIVNNLKESNV